MFLALNLFSAMSFLLYGTSCLLSLRMRGEFIRYGVSRYRVLVGWLQVVGGIGLIAGFWMSGVGALAALGLSILMLLGVGVRIQIKDSVLQTLPAACYLLINAYLLMMFYQRG